MMTEQEIIAALHDALTFYLCNQDAIEELNSEMGGDMLLTTINDTQYAEIINWLETKELEADVD